MLCQDKMFLVRVCVKNMIDNGDVRHKFSHMINQIRVSHQWGEEAISQHAIRKKQNQNNNSTLINLRTGPWLLGIPAGRSRENKV